MKIRNDKTNGRMIKRALCVGLAALMMLEACACGKGGAAGKFDSKIAEAKAVSEGTIYEETEFDFVQTDGYLRCAVGSGDLIYYAIQRGDTETESELNTLDINTGEIKNLDKITPDKNTLYTGIMNTPEGSVYITKTDYTAKTSILYKIENDALIEDIDLAKLGYVSGSPNSYSLYMLDKNGNYVLSSNDLIKICDKDAKELFTKKLVGNFILGCVNAKNGEIALYLKGYDDDDSSNYELMIIDTETYQIKKEIKLENGLSFDWPLLDAVGDYDFLCKNETSIMGYDIESETFEKIVDLYASNINMDESPEIYMLDENTFIADKIDYGNDTADDASFTFVKFKKQGDSDSADKIVLTYAARYGDPAVKQDIVDFNKSQSKYMIKLVDYSEADDPDAKLSADIAAGNFPDIYEVDARLGENSLDQAIEKGLFEDLVPYIEKDNEVSLDDLIPSVKNSIVTDGKCYFLPPSFSLYTIVGRKSEVKDVPGWSYQDMKEYCYSKKDSRLFFSNTKTDILFEFLVACGDEFIDWEKGECHFDNNDFKSVLEMANLGKDEDNDEEIIMREAEYIMDGKRLFREGVLALDDLTSVNVVYKEGFTIKGYPSSKGNGTHIVFPGMVAISSESKNKEGAWEFVRRYLTEEYQGKNYQSFMGEPTRKDVYEVKCEALKATEDTIDKYGNDVAVRNSTYSWGDLQIQLKPYTDEDIKIFNDAVENASGMVTYDYTVLEIISEEAAGYFAGDKSVDEVVKVIENRVNTYINENR